MTLDIPAQYLDCKPFPALPPQNTDKALAEWQIESVKQHKECVADVRSIRNLTSK